LSILFLLLAIYLPFANHLYVQKLTKYLSEIAIGQYTLEIEDTIVKITENGSSSEMVLSKIKCAIETHEILMLYLGRISFFVFPMSMFHNEAEKTEFIRLFPQNIEPSSLL